MTIPNNSISKNKMRGGVYILNFIYSLQVSVVAYFVSNYLLHYGLDKDYLSFVYTLISVVAILSFFISTKLFNIFGAYRVILVSALFYISIYLLQAFTVNISLIVILFVLGAIPSSFMVSGMDTLMERFTHNTDTGGQRGVFMTMSNAAFVAGPVLGGLLSGNGEYSNLWIAAAVMLFPFAVVSFLYGRRAERMRYKEFHIKKTIQAVIADKNIFNIFMAQFVLYFFFSIMVIYTAVYLHEVFSMSNDKIGYVTAIALMAYVFFVIPLGRLADKKYGEKEMLIIGMLIMGASTIAFALNNFNDFYVIATLLFLTRVGASFVQTMTETYFFKLIDAKDADLIGAFRAMYPLSSVIAPLFAFPFIKYMSFSSLFLALGLSVLFLGIYFASKIEDTK